VIRRFSTHNQEHLRRIRFCIFRKSLASLNFRKYLSLTSAFWIFPRCSHFVHTDAASNIREQRQSIAIRSTIIPLHEDHRSYLWRVQLPAVVTSLLSEQVWKFYFIATVFIRHARRVKYSLCPFFPCGLRLCGRAWNTCPIVSVASGPRNVHWYYFNIYFLPFYNIFAREIAKCCPYLTADKHETFLLLAQGAIIFFVSCSFSF